VALVVPIDGREARRLRELCTRVIDALGEVPCAVVTRAESGLYSAGGIELPAYLITVETAL